MPKWAVPGPASCHTVDGYLSIRDLVSSADPDTIRVILTIMKEEGDEYASGEYVHEGHVATDKMDYPFMPPFVGTDEELKNVIKIGDQVVFGKYTGDELEYEGKKYLVVQRSDILAILA